MIRISQRTRRGLAEALGVPSVIGGVAAALLILYQLFGAAA